MPIRLNLLAEAQAAEELRRRDPVKRALWLSVLVIAGMLAWSSFLQLRTTLANSDLTRMEAQTGARTNEFRQILDSQKKPPRSMINSAPSGNWPPAGSSTATCSTPCSKQLWRTCS